MGSSIKALRLVVLAPLPKGEDALAEQSAAGEAPELASAVVGGLVDGNQGLADGSQPLAHPAIKRDVPMVARVAHRIELAPGPPPVLNK